MKWLTERVYNRFDALWLMIMVLAIHDKEWIMAIVIAIGGCLVSSIMEYLAKATSQNKE
jgi:hypothetical protein